MFFMLKRFNFVIHSHRVDISIHRQDECIWKHTDAKTILR